MYQYYKIAGLTVKMDTFGVTADYAIPYLCGPDYEDADITIKVDNAVLQEYRMDIPLITESSCEYLASGKEFYIKLLDFDGMMLHACAVAYEGKAYLFSGDCEVGKSTHALLWRAAFGDEQIRILNDDKPAMRLENGRWYVYGTPWSGKNGLNQNLRYPLAGICYLEQGSRNRIQAYGDSDLVDRFVANTYRPTVLEKKLKLLSLVEQLIHTVPVWKMEATKEIEAARIAYEAMSREGKGTGEG